MKRILRGALLAFANKPAEINDILIEGGRISAIAPRIDAPDAELTDLSGKVLLPGLFDMQVHWREPGREDAETIASGAAAARAGGITGVLLMPDTRPAIDSGSMVRFVQNIAREKARIEVYTSGCISRGRAGSELAEIAEMKDCGALMITDAPSSTPNPLLLRRAMEYSRPFGLLVGCRSEDPVLRGDGLINEGNASYRLGLPGIPSIAIDIGVERDLAIARYTGAKVHIMEVSTRGSVEALRRARDAGVDLSASVTPHHLLFSEDDIQGYDTNYKLNPPLGTREDREALLQALREGLIDSITSAHEPHSSNEKRLDFAEAPFGVTGLQTLLLALYDGLLSPGILSWQDLVRACCDAPRQRLGLGRRRLAPGEPAELLVFDPSSETRCDRHYFASKSRNNLFLDKTLKGRIVSLIDPAAR